MLNNLMTHRIEKFRLRNLYDIFKRDEKSKQLPPPQRKSIFLTILSVC